MSTLGFIYMMAASPTLLILSLFCFVLAMWAQMKVKGAFNRAKRIRVQSGFSGAETAAEILRAFQIDDVRIEPVRGFLSDHYDPTRKVLRLSPDVYQGRSLAAVGIAAHEVGHAIQHATRYAPLALRNGIVPLASVGSGLSFILIIAGLILRFPPLAVVGLILFGTVVLFQLVNLPVEFNASLRARDILVGHGIVTVEEDKVVGQVLNAAAMTYIAATITAVLHLLYYAALVFGGARD